MRSTRKAPHMPITDPFFFRGAAIAPPDGVLPKVVRAPTCRKMLAIQRASAIKALYLQFH